MNRYNYVLPKLHIQKQESYLRKWQSHNVEGDRVPEWLTPWQPELFI